MPKTIPVVTRATELRAKREKHLRKAEKLWRKIVKHELLGQIHRVAPCREARQ